MTLKVDLGDLDCEQLAFSDELLRGLNQLDLSRWVSGAHEGVCQPTG
ncbi:hypothetical protein ACFWP7_09015 [Streptomyces sp. NPDC058470]